ncbi:hypothetical protein WKW77_12550 [Variovorax ureilyticus]|uniref:Uncharacterized protein n=1 Tax=Variovorax ureilyticus TaxID=1836198 RepID=A0ABU8VEJ3_9BURK
MSDIDSLSRRVLALDAKLATLSGETSAWREESKDAQARFAWHRSQIAEVCGDLEEMHAVISGELAELRKAQPLTVAAIERLERRILAALQIWECYRSKFAVRIEARLRESLILIDDLAWQAYRPAHDRAVASGRLPAERARLPPLVFPNARWSPFARSREQAYELDEATGVLRTIDDFEDYLRAIPVPLIGIPWYQVSHLPDAVFVGHEVGHLVEEDLGLEEDLRQLVLTALGAVDEERRAAWSGRWRSEVFADIYGVLATGPAFVGTLIDVLRGAPDIATESQPDAAGRWRAYPTRALRVRLVCEALRQLAADEPAKARFSQIADDFQAAWTATYPAHALPAYEDDVPRVVHALMHAPLEALARNKGGAGESLSSVLGFTDAMQSSAKADADRANKAEDPTGKDVRTLFAAVALAFRQDPGRYAAEGAQNRFRRRLLNLPMERVRAFSGAAPAAPEADRRKAAARWLFDRMEAGRV